MATISSIGGEISGFQVNTTPADFNAERDLPEGFLEFFQPLHQKFTHRRDELVADRAIVLADSHGGNKPVHRYPGHAVRNGWEITLPEWCQDQRNQMTGPADDGELVVKMLNSGAPGVMLDLEDSMANLWEHLELGIKNIHAAVRGELSYFDKKRNREVAINPSKTVIFTRARGLHLSQRLPGLGAKAGKQASDREHKKEFAAPDATENDVGLTSASLYDVCRMAFGVDPQKLKHPLSFYIPKSESAEEAL